MKTYYCTYSIGGSQRKVGGEPSDTNGNLIRQKVLIYSVAPSVALTKRRSEEELKGEQAFEWLRSPPRRGLVVVEKLDLI